MGSAHSSISLSQARRLALNCQLLDRRTKSPGGKEGVARTIERLGYVQIDTIAVIERAHHHTLWSRCPDYHADMLHQLQAVDRRVFEYWGHAASYLPISDYRFYLPRMRGFEEPHHKWEKQRLEKFGHLMPAALERIRQEGPLGSIDFNPPHEKKHGAWWDWRPTKVALELLFWRGELMITERRNFHRRYDLTERVLPKNIDTTKPTNDELGRFLVNRALSAYGVAREKEICEHIHGTDKKIISLALADMVSAGEVVGVTIGKDKSTLFYALPDYLERGTNLKKATPRVHPLSPFDNMIIQRERLQRLFDFDYVLECYVPAPKRKFGYFTLPILWGEQFVGRLDPKADRKKRMLLIRSLRLEADFKPSNRFLAALAKKLRLMARFNECDEVEVETCSQKSVKRVLQSLLRKARK